MRRPWLLYLVLVFGLSSIPADPRPKHAPMFLDKVAHFVLYSGLGFVFAGSRDGRRWSGLRLVLVSMLVAGLVGLADEFYQGFVPHRSRELADWLADLSGGVCGGLLALGPRPEDEAAEQGERTP